MLLRRKRRNSWQLQASSKGLSATICSTVAFGSNPPRWHSAAITVRISGDSGS
jgi:hypothetical protein